MNNLGIRYNDSNDTLELYFSGTTEFREYLSSLSQDKRIWSSDQKCWVILPDTLPQVIAFSKPVFDKIDYSSLPFKYQNIVEGVLDDKFYFYDKGSKSNNNYSTLFLTNSAPYFLVKSVYKLLAKKYHPDGDSPNSDRFKEIQTSYENIQNKMP